MSDAELEGLATFLYEMGQLKRSKRTGWWLPGVKDPESVAEHSFRTAVIGHLLAVMEGADPARTALLCLFHDTQETRVGDIPSVGRGYLATAPNEQITNDQVAPFPAEVGQAVRELVAEYEARTSLEAQVARDADKLECLVQAREYEVQGYANVAPWVETSAAALRTVSAKRLAEACQQVPPGEWWRTFVESYGRAPRPGTDPRPAPDAED
jgi:putative hydrolases of HD superfamily